MKDPFPPTSFPLVFFWKRYLFADFLLYSTASIISVYIGGLQRPIVPTDKNGNEVPVRVFDAFKTPREMPWLWGVFCQQFSWFDKAPARIKNTPQPLYDGTWRHDNESWVCVCVCASVLHVRVCVCSMDRERDRKWKEKKAKHTHTRGYIERESVFIESERNTLSHTHTHEIVRFG